MPGGKLLNTFIALIRRPPAKLLYCIIFALIIIASLLVTGLYGGSFETAFDPSYVRHKFSKTVRNIRNFFIDDSWYVEKPSIVRVNFYAYGGLTIDVKNAPEGEAEIMVDGKDISATLRNQGSFVSDDDGKTYERYDFDGSVQELNVSVGTNEIVMKYATAILPTYEMNITLQQMKEYEKTYRQKLFNAKLKRQGKLKKE